MAKVAIFHSSGIFYNGVWQTVCFYEGLINSLVEQGNDVLQFVTNDFLARAWNGTNTTRHAGYKTQIHKALKEFNPDLVITLNNSCIEGIEECLDCPIALWDADSPPFFNDKDTIKRNPARYHFLAFADSGIESYKKYFNADPSRIFKVPNATAVQSDMAEKKYNISFIGTCFGTPISLSHMMSINPKKTLDLVRICDGKSEKDIAAILQAEGYSLDELKPTDVLFCRSRQNRLDILSAIHPLGVKIFGDQTWWDTYQSSFDIAMSYDDRLVFSLAHNASIYNRSNIAINISHGQAVTGYPWRVLDVMASDAALISDFKSELVADFQSKVPLQLFNTPLEAYELCKKVLQEPSLRQDIVKSSQEAINQGYRWHHRFRDLEQIFGISLLSLDKSSTHVRFKIAVSDMDAITAHTVVASYKRYRIIREKFHAFFSKKIKRKPFKSRVMPLLPPSIVYALTIALNQGNNDRRKLYD